MGLGTIWIGRDGCPTTSGARSSFTSPSTGSSDASDASRSARALRAAPMLSAGGSGVLALLRSEIVEVSTSSVHAGVKTRTCGRFMCTSPTISLMSAIWTKRRDV